MEEKHDIVALAFKTKSKLPCKPNFSPRSAVKM